MAHQPYERQAGSSDLAQSGALAADLDADGLAGRVLVRGGARYRIQHRLAPFIDCHGSLPDPAGPTVLVLDHGQGKVFHSKVVVAVGRGDLGGPLEDLLQAGRDPAMDLSDVSLGLSSSMIL
jgi:hypothetical protein